LRQGDPPLHEVVDRRLAVARRLQPHHEGRVGGRRRVRVPPRRDEERGAAGGLRRRAERLDLGLAGIAAVGGAGVEHGAGGLGVPFVARRLAHRLAVPAEAEPSQAVEDRLRRLRRRAGAVGVLDPEQEAAAEVAGMQPVEERGPRTADVEKAGGRRREAGDHVLSHHPR
jgi:hypothetical protein